MFFFLLCKVDTVYCSKTFPFLFFIKTKVRERQSVEQGFAKLYIYTFEQENVVFLIGAARILPIDVQTVEASLAEIRYGTVDERLARVSRRRHVLELLRAEGPSA